MAMARRTIRSPNSAAAPSLSDRVTVVRTAAGSAAGVWRRPSRMKADTMKLAALIAIAASGSTTVSSRPPTAYPSTSDDCTEMPARASASP